MIPSALKGKGEGGTDIGAEVLYRYQDGMLTNVPLWPWPMEDRIFRETGVSVTWEANGGLWKTLDEVYVGTPVTPTADTTPPSTPGGLAATVISSTQINLSWTASTDPVITGQATSGVTGYKIYRNGTQIATTSNTNYSDTGLSPSTTYTYSVAAYDAAGNNSNQSGSVSVSTQAAPDTQASSPSSTTVYEDAEDGTIKGWDVYDNYIVGATITNVYDYDRMSRVIQLTGSGWENGYRLRKDDMSAWNNSTQFIIEWSMKYSEDFNVYIDAETTAGHRYIYYRPNDYNSLGTGGYVHHGLGSGVIDGKWHTFVRDLQADLKEAQPGVTILQVNGFLIRGSGRVDDIKLSNKIPVTDTQAPTIPTNLTATPISSSQINLSWIASTDNVGVTGYKVHRNGTPIATTTNTNYSDIGLSPSTTYTYTVSAYDAAGNVSVQSSPASATTQAAPDTQAPTVPNNLAATTTSSTQMKTPRCRDSGVSLGNNYYFKRSPKPPFTKGIQGIPTAETVGY